MSWKAKLDSDVIDVLRLYRRNDSHIWELPKGGYICRLCDEPMILVGRGSNFVRPHFRHLTAPEHGGKGATHEAAQIWLIEKLESEYPQFDIDYEHHIKLTDGSDRFIDVAVIDRNTDDVVEAHEIQISRQVENEFSRRTEEYNSIGIPCIWWLRDGGQNDRLRFWLVENYGRFGVLFIDEKTELLEKREPIDRPLIAMGS